MNPMLPIDPITLVFVLTSLGIIVVAILSILYFGHAIISGILEVKGQPREPMFMCDKHGAFRQKHLITLLDQKYCPMCFDEKLKMPLDGSVAI